MLSGENRLSDAPPADPAPAAGGAAAVPNPPLVCPNEVLLPAEAGASAPKPLPNPPPLFAVEEKLNPEAEPNPEAAGLLVVGYAKEKLEDEVAAAEEEPNPEGGCVGAAAGALPKPVEDDGAAEEPNPPVGAAKLKLLASAGAGAPNPLLPKLDVEDPNPVTDDEPKSPDDA